MTTKEINKIIRDIKKRRGMLNEDDFENDGGPGSGRKPGSKNLSGPYAPDHNGENRHFSNNFSGQLTDVNDPSTAMYNEERKYGFTPKLASPEKAIEVHNRKALMNQKMADNNARLRNRTTDPNEAALLDKKQKNQRMAAENHRLISEGISKAQSGEGYFPTQDSPGLRKAYKPYYGEQEFGNIPPAFRNV